MGEWSHDALQNDLAESRKVLDEIVVQKLALGSYSSGGQADVVAVRPSWVRPVPTVYEVKVSRSDYRADVRTAKYERYLRYCQRLYFAAPKGMLGKADIPDGMGLTVRGPTGWHVVKAPRLRKPVEPGDWAVLLFGIVLRGLKNRQVLSRDERALLWAEHENLHDARLRLGLAVGSALRDADQARAELECTRMYLPMALGIEAAPGESLSDLVTRAALKAHKEGHDG